jgi:hypothetical protein
VWRDENPPAGGQDGSNLHVIVLNSKAVTKNWKKRLTPEETIRLRRQVEDVATYYYGDDDW